MSAHPRTEHGADDRDVRLGPPGRRPCKRQRIDVHTTAGGSGDNTKDTTTTGDTPGVNDQERASGPEWSDLPDEVVYLIAEYCAIGTLARLAQTDRRTHALVRDDRLWKNLCRMRAETDPTACPAGPACVRGRGSDRTDDLTSRTRHWLATDARERSTDRAPGGPHAPPPWLWNEFKDADPLGCCVCHVPRGGVDGPCDHRWLYASSLTPPVTYHRGPGSKPRRVGRIVDVPNWRWRWVSLLGSSPSGEGGITRRSCTYYSGEVDAQDRPHGRGTLVVLSEAPSHSNGSNAITPTVVYRMAGHWSHGAANGAMRMRNYARDDDQDIYCNKTVYFDGMCKGGRPRGRGLVVLGKSVYDGKWDPSGYPTGAGFSCSDHGLVRYGLDRGSHRSLMHHVVLRPDGTVACEDAYADPYDDDDCCDHAHDVDSDAFDDNNCDVDNNEILRDADIDALIARAAAACDRDLRARSAPVGEGYSVIRDRAGKVVYTGLLDGDFSPCPGRGTLFLPDGGHVTYIGKIEAAGRRRRLASITYAGGDRVTCLVVPSSPSDAPVVLAFTFSSHALPPFARRTIRTPWRVLSLSSPPPSAPIDTPPKTVPDNSDLDRHRAHGEDGMVGDGVVGRNDEGRDGNDDDIVSIDACPDDTVVTHLTRYPPVPAALDAMRALAGVAFWPAVRGEERDAFFDHMTARYGSRWAAYRAVADAVPPS
ncbi:F-box domain containing protein [Pandoravirus salinus]|uniref:F-box domain containing protein n=1 Tax=Pandoravirus salinus TaxID=1349410 RepID=S4VWB0_9VIRU|nr:F-box domain [Pandoravirus salinus]AGO84643.1 F-box domain containing protein [Pandoravirus salinus]